MKREESKLIRCVLPAGKALSLLETIKDSKGITTANINYSRGFSLRTALFLKKSVEVRVENEILDVLVPKDRADELFEFIYDSARIGEEQGSFMYMLKLQRDVPFVLPVIPEAG
jgi:hypothetical protein